MGNELATTNPASGALSIADLKAQVNLIQQVMREVMQSGEHFGVIPGTFKTCEKCEGKGKTGTPAKDCPDCEGKGKKGKPTLLKPGAEKLCLVFRMDPQYEVEQTYDGQHLTVFSKCTLYHITSGARLGSGCGSCSTKESKYAYRNANRKCPLCGKETIFKSKDGSGWYCWVKKNGCGAKFAETSPDGMSIESQTVGRIANEDIADQYNTVLKMSNKRSLVAAVLSVTAASDIFTQDLEEIVEVKVEVKPEVKPSIDPVIPTETPAYIPPTKEESDAKVDEAFTDAESTDNLKALEYHKTQLKTCGTTAARVKYMKSIPKDLSLVLKIYFNELLAGKA